jgi:hypothetical protein
MLSKNKYKNFILKKKGKKSLTYFFIIYLFFNTCDIILSKIIDEKYKNLIGIIVLYHNINTRL